MTGAALLLLVNIAVTGFFAAAFAAVAVIAPGQRSAFWFAGAYGIGALTPLSEFLLPLSPAPGVLALSSYASFLCGPLLISIGIAAIAGQKRPWRAFAAILVSGIILRIGIWNGTRNTLAYDLAYQLPFALAAMLACRTAMESNHRAPLRTVLGWLFAVIAAQFVVKPFLAVAFGSGNTARDYVHSAYAIISQASTAVLLVAAGLLILLIVVQKAVGESQIASETDPLSQLANRRGFDRQGQQLVSRAAREQLSLCAIIFDLDHFKHVNDSHGHLTGDQVIASFGETLRRSMPPTAIVGRIGGEEFAILLPACEGETAWLQAEAIRRSLHHSDGTCLPRVTVSGGVAEWRPGDGLLDLMRRADEACYGAKRSGRDRVHTNPNKAGRSNTPVSALTRDLVGNEPAFGSIAANSTAPDAGANPAASDGFGYADTSAGVRVVARSAIS